MLNLSKKLKFPHPRKQNQILKEKIIYKRHLVIGLLNCEVSNKPHLAFWCKIMTGVSPIKNNPFSQ